MVFVFNHALAVDVIYMSVAVATEIYANCACHCSRSAKLL